MLSKNQLKLITSLRQKKYRLQHHLFIAEGVKVVNELLSSNSKLEKLFCTEDYYPSIANYNPHCISEKELKKISTLSTPNKVLGLFRIPEPVDIKNNGLILILDAINDPGNLGTIIRLCDWFGVSHLVCSKDTVDCFNTKVVQATMGSLARLPITYLDIGHFLDETKLPIYGAVMQGNNVYASHLAQNAILVMSNESKGISKEIEMRLNHKITIPKFNLSKLPESLNVATATAVLLNEFRRTTIIQK